MEMEDMVDGQRAERGTDRVRTLGEQRVGGVWKTSTFAGRHREDLGGAGGALKMAVHQ